MNRVIEGWNIRIWVGPAEGWMVAIRLFLPTDPVEPIMEDRLPLYLGEGAEYSSATWFINITLLFSLVQINP